MFPRCPLIRCTLTFVASFAVAGYNATVFAYGQSGSGKTFTMGTSTSTLHTPAEGMIPRAMKKIFRIVEEDIASGYRILCSFIEIYNEEFMDLLLGVSSKPKDSKEIQIREDADGRIMVNGLSELQIESVEAALMLLEKGNSVRRTAGTLLNEVSSRSHAIFTINIEKYIGTANESENDDDGEILFAKLHLVDLAGK